ncbi:MAG: hypothetical protein LUG18_04560, partial [Candidatus Azobacteroides sp.]|nr:hypothetical protein [Candidatus Azobacteroides sp.]
TYEGSTFPSGKGEGFGDNNIFPDLAKREGFGDNNPLYFTKNSQSLTILPLILLVFRLSQLFPLYDKLPAFNEMKQLPSILIDIPLRIVVLSGGF